MPSDPADAEVDFYDDPVVYDVLHTPGTAAEVDGLERLARRFARSRPEPAGGTVWLEPACGSGRYLRVIASRMDRGADGRVIGVDLNERMIAYARARAARAGHGDRARYVVGDMTRLDDHVRAGSVDAAFCLINSIRHLPTPAAMRAHLESVRRALKPGGVYAVGLSTSRAEWEFESEDVWSARRGTLHVRQVVQYEPPAAPEHHNERVRSHLTLTTPTGVRTTTSTYTLRAWRLEAWERVVARARLGVVGVVDERGDDIEPPPCAYGVWVLGAQADGR